MKKISGMLPVLLLLLCCIAACAPQGSSEARDPVQAPTLAFIEPGQPYWMLGECAYGDGYLAVYEEAFDEAYNRRFSSDESFYAIRWQLFDAEGNHVGTGDSGWSNCFAIHGLPLTELTAGDGLVTFSAEMPEEYDRWPFRRKFTLIVDDERLPAPKENPNGGRYRTEDWYRLAETEGSLLESCSSYDWTSGRSLNRLLLTDPSGGQRETVFDCDDQDFWNELLLLNRPGYVDFEGEEPAESRMKIELRPREGIAVFTIPKLTATVDFSAGKTEVKRHYTAEMLQTKLAESPDGRRAVYTAGEFDRFESVGGCDFVSAGPDGEIRFLCAGSELDQVAFIGNDRIIINSFDALTCYDAATGQPSKRQIPFDYGEAAHAQDARALKYLTVGLAVDQKNERVLAAYRLNSFGNWELEVEGELLSELPVSLAVFDFSGRRIAEIETGLAVRPFAKFTLIPVEISTDQAGGATLWTEYFSEGEQRVTVSYPV